MRWIYLGKDDKFTCVDDEDYETLKNQLWTFGSRGYVVSNDPNPKATNYRSKPLHMYLFKSNIQILVDHINRDRLDNTRGNLRIVNRRLNAINMGAPKINMVPSNEDKQKAIRNRIELKKLLRVKTLHKLKDAGIRKRRSVINNKNEIYSCVAEAAEAHGVGSHYIQSRCLGKVRNTKDVGWYYADTLLTD